ncbi:hypothetical protein FQ154_18435, partial [Paeniglutamicibacter gangotriensis]
MVFRGKLRVVQKAGLVMGGMVDEKAAGEVFGRMVAQLARQALSEAGDAEGRLGLGRAMAPSPRVGALSARCAQGEAPTVRPATPSSKALLVTHTETAACRRTASTVPGQQRVSRCPKADDETAPLTNPTARQGGGQRASAGKERGRQAPSSLPPP